jgi:two-component system CheB/CheR fusion protein
VLGALPAAFPAPIVVAQHLDPRVPSNLASILAKRTTLRVVAVDTTAPLEASTVYVVPADRHVEITDHHVAVHADGIHGRPKPSIDLLFATAADVFGERLIAVVLSGLGSDGSDGARSVKRHGGRVIIEDPLTAAFPSMPASLEPSVVDFIAPIDRIGPELTRLVNESIDLPDDSPALAELLERVRTKTGIDFSYYKLPTIKRRLARQISSANRKTIGDYLLYLDEDPSEFARLVSNFLIKVTEFFRDAEMFDALRDTIVPQLIDDARTRGAHELRVWSAGCATGEEAYSLAILIAEALRTASEPFNVRIFATDIDEAAIAFARRGVYPPDSALDLDPQIMERYFVPVDDGWEVSKTIREMTVFGQHDLGQRAPFPRIDLVLCRNVLIYFSKDLQQRTLQVFAFSLRNGGYLALGKAETTAPLAEYFVVVNPALRIFRRYGERVTIPPSPTKPAATLREIERVQRPFPAFEPSARETRITVNEKLGAFLTTSAIGVILVDRRYDILAINATARAMFNIHGVAIGYDLVHLMRPESAAHVRSLLDAALRNQQPGAEPEEITLGGEGDDEPRTLTLTCYPEIAEGTQEVTGAVILAVDVTEIASARRDSQRTIESQTQEMQQLRAAETRARERQRSLVEANRELANANSQLRAQNDALVINAEEAAASTEEVETLNEEMQATNEELETLNEEFQATIEELNTTNDEHEARATELADQLALRQAQARAAEAAVAAHAAIVDGLPNAVAAVDAQGTIVVANRRFREIQNDAPESSVQIDDESGATVPLRVILRRAGEGEAFAFRYRSISPDQSLTVYAGRTRPLPDNGAVRTIVELVPAPST